MTKKRLSMFEVLSSFIFILLCLVTLYPFLYVFMISISDGTAAMTKNIFLLPAGVTLTNYYVVLSDHRIAMSLFISVSRTLVGTLAFLLVTGLCAYSMSKSRMPARKALFIFFVIPMYVNGGLLPYYVLIHDLGLMNNFLVYILPLCFAPFYMFLMKVYFEGIPESLEESAKLDGAGDLKIAANIYLPLSKPVIVTVILFIGVSQWNSWFDALLYVNDTKLYPMQLVLQNVMKDMEISSFMQIFNKSNSKTTVSTQTLKMAMLIITALPVIIVYPFAQKYFIKGMTMGSIKL